MQGRGGERLGISCKQLSGSVCGYHPADPGSKSQALLLRFAFFHFNLNFNVKINKKRPGLAHIKIVQVKEVFYNHPTIVKLKVVFDCYVNRVQSQYFTTTQLRVVPRPQKVVKPLSKQVYQFKEVQVTILPICDELVSRSSACGVLS